MPRTDAAAPALRIGHEVEREVEREAVVTEAVPHRAPAASRTRSPPGSWRLFGPALLVWAAAAFAVVNPGTGRWIAVAAIGAGALMIALAVIAAGAGVAAGARSGGATEHGATWATGTSGTPLRAEAYRSVGASGEHGAAETAGRVLAGREAGGRPAVGRRRGARGSTRGFAMAGGAARTALRHGAVLCAALALLGASIDAGEWARADPRLAEAVAEQRQLRLDVVLRGFPRSQPAEFGGERGWVAAAVPTPRGEVPVVLWLSAETEIESSAGAETGRGADTATERRAEAVNGSSTGGRASWAPGTRLTVHGVTVPLEPGAASAYGVRVGSARGVPASGRLDGVVADVGKAAAELRGGLRQAAAQVPGAELVPGLAVGDTALVGAPLELRMQQSSLTHLVAVSGANCALVTGAAIWLAGLLGAGRRLRIALAGVMLAGFVFVVGPDASVQRAAVMGAVVLASGFGGRRAVALPALGAAMLLMLLADPWQALQPGFALSVAATAGILLLVPEIERLLRRVAPVPRWIVLPVAVALSAQLACGPLLLLLQPGIPAVGVLANVLAGPAAPLGTGLGLIALLALPISPTLGEAAVAVAGLPARWISATAEVTAQLPLARWPWPDGWAGALLLAFVELALLAAWSFAAHRIRLPEDRAAGRVPWRGWRRLSTRGRAVVAVLLCAAAGTFSGPVLVAPAVARIGTPSDWFVVACDVGQGDAILLRDPDRPAEVMLVDTGDDPALLRICLDRFGVTRIALLVLTHDDRDHVGALSEVIHTVEAALVAPDNREDGGSRPVLAQLRAAGVPHRTGETGLRGGGTGLGWEVLAPAPGAVPADSNAASLVLRVEAGGALVMLLADTGEDEQRALRAGGADLSAAVVKIAHHGSRDQDPALAGAIGAELALVSVGAGNGYGHPAAAALDAFARVGARPLRTDRHGSLAISGSPGELRAWAERTSASSPETAAP